MTSYLHPSCDHAWTMRSLTGPLLQLHPLGALQSSTSQLESTASHVQPTAQGQMDALMSRILSNPNATLQSLEDDGLVRFSFPSAGGGAGSAPAVSHAPGSQPLPAATQPQAAARAPMPMVFESPAELQTLLDVGSVSARPLSAGARTRSAPEVNDAPVSQPPAAATQPQAAATQPRPFLLDSEGDVQSLIDAGIMRPRSSSAGANTSLAPIVKGSPGSQPLPAATQPQVAATAPSLARASGSSALCHSRCLSESGVSATERSWRAAG